MYNALASKLGTAKCDWPFRSNSSKHKLTVVIDSRAIISDEWLPIGLTSATVLSAGQPSLGSHMVSQPFSFLPADIEGSYIRQHQYLSVVLASLFPWQ